MKPSVVILSAGLGTRMKSGIAKALHPVAGRPMVRHVLDAAASLDPEKIILVVGHQAEAVRKAVEQYHVEIVHQAEQLGTGHAVRQAKNALSDVHGPVVVLCADTPLLTADTLSGLVSKHTTSGAVVTLLTAEIQDPFGYGRILRDDHGVKAVVEEKDATLEQKKIREVNTGVYCFEKDFLLASIDVIGNENAQAEYYLPDAVALARERGLIVSAFVCLDPDEVMGVNTRLDLSRAEEIMAERINKQWMLAGVSMPRPKGVFIGMDCVLARDVTIYENVRIEGRTEIGEGSTIYPGVRISDSIIGRGVVVKDCSVIEGSTVLDNASIGPFAHLRPGTVIGERAKIGNFVEVKKSVIGEGSKANHLAYIGDADIGRGVNIGAGVITCNYDGFEKHATVIEDNVFVGSDSQLVAPVRIGKGAVVAAGATITKDVPPDALAISRAPQENKEGLAERRRKAKEKKRKA